MRILHFADAHIDMLNRGKHDPETGLPVRVMDFLRSLDVIVETAIEEKVDLVLFAGDAFKDRSPAPTFIREWGKRIMRLSRAGIPTVLLVGNHDLSPALGRAHALDPFNTFEVPHVHVVDRPTLLTPNDLDGLPLQIVALPWVSRSGMLAFLGDQAEGLSLEEVYSRMADLITSGVENLIEQATPELPLVLTAHASVQGAKYGAERLVMLGNDLVLPASLVKNPRWAYVALGHIHKAQDLNEGHQPPVIYPGSIERVDFGEAHEDKFFVIATIEPGKPTQVSWRKLPTRPVIDHRVTLTNEVSPTQRLIEALGPQEALEGAVVRLVVTYPQELEAHIDDAALYAHTKHALEFHLIKRPQVEARARLGNEPLERLTPLELVDKYLLARGVEGEERKALLDLAREILDRPSETAG
ncbi:MAG TPA: exonuclease SbcCD subunit D [Chloroflexi bacterium]|nr:exonuclease SbcCD subunit D [Chloroflexota bacterium]